MAEVKKQVVVEREPQSNVGTIVVVVVVVGIILLILALMYGLPYLTGGNNSTTNVNVPAPTTGSGAGN